MSAETTLGPEPTTAALIADLERRREAALHAGSTRSVDKQHAKGKLTARERLDLLLDPGSFTEYDEFVQHRATGFGLEHKRPLGDGVVTGLGRIDGRQVAVYAHDFTVFGGSVGEAFAGKVLKIMRLAGQLGCPLFGLNDSSGARIQEGVVALGAYGDIAHESVKLSGVVPQISLIMGPCAGGASYAPIATDFVGMVQGTSHMFITGPEIVNAVTGASVTLEELGGGRINAELAGNVHYLAHDEKDLIDWARNLLSFLPANNLEDPPRYQHTNPEEITDGDRTLDGIIPDARNMAYEMNDVIAQIVDGGEFTPISSAFGRSIICGFGRVDGGTIGVVANQPRVNAGALDIDASEKAARFIRTCNVYNIPVLFLVDVPGYMPGVEQESAGIIRRGAKLGFAVSESTVPMVTVVLRKAYGGGYAVMGSKHADVDINLAWPTAEIAVMGGQGAILLMFRNEMQRAREEGREVETRAKLLEMYNESMTSPYLAAARGYLDAVIPPRETRLRVANAFAALANKRVSGPTRKHSNIPL